MNAKKVLKKGFTLIEVVIVLAIAALIMVVVFLAVTGAQRAQRDQARKDYANAGVAKLNEFNGNAGSSTVAIDETNFKTYMGNRLVNGSEPSVSIGAAADSNSECTDIGDVVVQNGAAAADQKVAICLESKVWYTANSQ